MTYLPFDDVVKAALRVIEANHYFSESDPHADAEQQYSGEQLALAARRLVDAVNRMPANEQPIGWPETPAQPTAEETVDRAREQIGEPCEEFRRDGECSCPIKHPVEESESNLTGNDLRQALRGHLFGGSTS